MTSKVFDVSHAIELRGGNITGSGREDMPNAVHCVRIDPVAYARRGKVWATQTYDSEHIKNAPDMIRWSLSVDIPDPEDDGKTDRMLSAIIAAHTEIYG